MSLKAMLAAHDDSALAALSSKGLTRRARRDAQSGKARITFVDETRADITVDGESINLNDKGPLAAKCTCSATKMCRHILTAVMVLGAQENDVAAQDALAVPEKTAETTELAEPKKTKLKQKKAVKTPKISTAKDDLIGVSEAALIKFAGADLIAALGLAATIDAPEISEDGLNLTISLPGSPASVTFIAGQGLKGVAYKGPKTKKRLVTTACAIIVRRIAGLPFEHPDNLSAEDEIGIAQKDAIDMARTITESVRAVLTGVPAIASDQLFDKAITARVQSAPRLTAQLRALAKQAMLATTRHVDYDPTEFLENAANTYALCHAISKTPDDVNLTGSLRRNYDLSEPATFWMLGARSWKSAAGARGLTCYGYCPERQDWLETTTARGAGMDLSFSGSQAYEGVLWRAGTPRSAMGYAVTLPSPAISKDGQVSQTITDAGKIGRDRLSLPQLESQNAVFKTWSALREHIMAKMGTGIRRRAFPVPALVKPHRHLDMRFDEMAQLYKWGLVDQHNEVIHINLPADDTETAQHIRSSRKKICGVLVAARLDGYEVIYEPVSILMTYKSDLTVFNIGLDHIQHRRLLGRKKLNLADFFPKFTAPMTLNHSASTALLDRCLDTLVDVSISPARSDRLKTLMLDCEQAGLMALARTIENTDKHLSEDSILKAVYVLNETRQMMSLSA